MTSSRRKVVLAGAAVLAAAGAAVAAAAAADAVSAAGPKPADAPVIAIPPAPNKWDKPPVE